MSADDQGVVSFLEADKQQIYVFASGAGHHLPVIHWDGAQWKWSDHWSVSTGPQGIPDVGGAPGVISFREDAQPRQIFAFLRLEGGGLLVNYWDGIQWKWAFPGTPPGTKAHPGVGVVTYREGTEPQRIHAFVSGYDGHVHMYYRAGSQWRWVNQGTPPGALAANGPAVVTYQEATPSQRIRRIYVFVTGDDGHLHLNYWDGSQWIWADQGVPPTPGVKVFNAPGVITYREGAQQRIHAFVGGVDSHLYRNYWDGSQWKWADHGMSSGTKVESSPGVVTYADDIRQRIYAFVRGSDGHLHLNYSDGLQWKWVDQGMPSRASVHSAPAVITYREGTQPQRIYAFVRGTDGHLHVNYWNGSQWKWADLGLVADLPVSGGQ